MSSSETTNKKRYILGILKINSIKNVMIGGDERNLKNLVFSELFFRIPSQTVF